MAFVVRWVAWVAGKFNALIESFQNASVREKNQAQHRLPLLKMELAIFRFETSANIFEEKLGFRMVR